MLQFVPKKILGNVQKITNKEKISGSIEHSQ